jgi:hypothetical protein
MSDYRGDNILEKIGAFVPGYAGYAQREGRRHSDKRLRTAMTKAVMAKKRVVDDAVQRLTGEGKLAMVPPLDAIRRQLDLIANRLSFANSGTSGFFDIVQINEQDLDRVYAHDLLMVINVRDSLQNVDALTTAAEPSVLVPAIHDALKHLEHLIDERNKILMEA